MSYFFAPVLIYYRSPDLNDQLVQVITRFRVKFSKAQNKIALVRRASAIRIL